MQPRAQTYLNDVLAAAQLIAEFTAGLSFDGYEGNLLIRSAVERQFTIIGEAVTQFARIEPQAVNGISDYRRIIGFRNVLTHAYADVQAQVVWDAVETRLPILTLEVAALLPTEE